MRSLQATYNAVLPARCACDCFTARVADIACDAEQARASACAHVVDLVVVVDVGGSGVVELAAGARGAAGDVGRVGAQSRAADAGQVKEGCCTRVTSRAIDSIAHVSCVAATRRH
jgi:hypothetical protein